MEKIVCISIEALYKEFKDGKLSRCYVEVDDNGTYYDLYTYDGELVCMDGEEVNIVETGDNLVTLRNDNGEYTVYFTLTKEEFEKAVI